MVKYKSRAGLIGKPVKARAKKKKRRSKKMSGGGISKPQIDKRGGTDITGGSSASGGSAISGGALIDPAKITQATKRAQDIIGNIIKSDNVKERAQNIVGKIGEKAQSINQDIDIDKIGHKIMTHIIQHASPHQFSLVRGIASKFLKIPHHMDNYIASNLGSSFKIPKGIHRQAMMDVIKAPSQHFLAEMLHTEKVDKDSGMNVGGGLLDSLKAIYKKGLSAGRALSRKAISVGKSFDNMLKKGIVIAESIEPVVSAFNPEIGDALSKGLSAAEKVQTGLDVSIKSADAINSLLHGDVGNSIVNIANASKVVNELRKKNKQVVDAPVEANAPEAGGRLRDDDLLIEEDPDDGLPPDLKAILDRIPS